MLLKHQYIFNIVGTGVLYRIGKPDLHGYQGLNRRDFSLTKQSDRSHSV